MLKQSAGWISCQPCVTHLLLRWLDGVYRHQRSAPPLPRPKRRTQHLAWIKSVTTALRGGSDTPSAPARVASAARAAGGATWRLRRHTRQHLACTRLPGGPPPLSTHRQTGTANARPRTSQLNQLGPVDGAARPEARLEALPAGGDAQHLGGPGREPTRCSAQRRLVTSRTLSQRIVPAPRAARPLPPKQSPQGWHTARQRCGPGLRSPQLAAKCKLPFQCLAPTWRRCGVIISAACECEQGSKGVTRNVGTSQGSQINAHGTLWVPGHRTVQECQKGLYAGPSPPQHSTHMFACQSGVDHKVKRPLAAKLQLQQHVVAAHSPCRQPQPGASNGGSQRDGDDTVTRHSYHLAQLEGTDCCTTASLVYILIVVVALTPGDAARKAAGAARSATHPPLHRLVQEGRRRRRCRLSGHMGQCQERCRE